MDLIELFFVAITPGLALCLALYLADHFDKEPFRYLLVVFILGCLSTIPSLFFEYLLQPLNIFNGWISSIFTAFITIALVEEFFKRGVILLTVYRNNIFNEKLDGIIYSSFSALGFATIENILYVVVRFRFVPGVGLFRAFLSVPAHMLYAITMGYYISLAKFTDDENLKKVYLRKSLTIPVILHGIFDLILIINIPGVTIFFIPFVVYLWYVNLKKLAEFYRDSKINYFNSDN